MKTSDAIFILLLIIVAAILLIFMPFVQIWAINTLFKTTIEYSWLNWFTISILNASIKNISWERKQ
jgi:hypothetical protein